MKSIALIVFGLLVAGSFIRADDSPATRPHVTKITCVGDSITYGSGLPDRKHDAYPAQLQQMLGDQWEVNNFGVSGATLLKKGDRPYWNQKRFQAALDSEPDIVVIKLGTNDSKPQNWKHKEAFAADLADMVQKFEMLPSHPTVWLCHPVPAFPEYLGIRDEIIHNEIVPIINAVAKEQNTKVIDLYGALAGKADLFPDKIHPNAEGARLMALEVFRSLTGKAYEPATTTTAPAAAR